MQMDFELEGMDLGEMGAPDLSRPEEFSPGFEGNEYAIILILIELIFIITGL